MIRPLPPLLLLLPLALAACADGRGSGPVVRPAVERLTVVDEETRAARELLGRVTPAVAADAFRYLETREYEVEVFFRELDEEGAVTRSRRRTISRAPDSTRGGSETLLGEVLAGQNGSLAVLRHIDPIPILLPARPAYLRPGTNDYAFRRLPDRYFDGRRIRGAEAIRRTRVDEPLRLVRGWEDALTGEPVAIEILRQSSSMLLTEDVRLAVTLASDQDGLPLPVAARVDASIQVLAERRRHFMIDMALRPEIATP